MYNTYRLSEDDAALLEDILREHLKNSPAYDPDVATLLKYIASRGEEGRPRVSSVPQGPVRPSPRRRS